MVLCCCDCGSKNDQVDDPEEEAGGPGGAEAGGLFISQLGNILFFLFLQRIALLGL